MNREVMSCAPIGHAATKFGAALQGGAAILASDAARHVGVLRGFLPPRTAVLLRGRAVGVGVGHDLPPCIRRSLTRKAARSACNCRAWRSPRNGTGARTTTYPPSGS